MKAPPFAWVVATGARGPLGFSSLQVAMSARAQKLEPRASSYRDKRGYPIGHARALGLGDRLSGYDRLVALATPALREALSSAEGARAPLFLALPEPGRADDDPRLGREILSDLARRSGTSLDLERSMVIRQGNAGFAAAIEAARGALAARDAPPLAIAGGVDSHAHPGVLSDLDEARRLHAPGVEDGFIPSEGAAFLLLSRARPAAPIAGITHVAMDRETSIERGEPNTARALTAVLRAAVEGGEAGWALHDVNGEHPRIREWTMAATRVLAGRDATVTAMVDELGDAGAAIGPTLAVIACAFWSAGCAPAGCAVLAMSSDGPMRAAIRMERADDG